MVHTHVGELSSIRKYNLNQHCNKGMLKLVTVVVVLLLLLLFWGFCVAVVFILKTRNSGTQQECILRRHSCGTSIRVSEDHYTEPNAGEYITL